MPTRGRALARRPAVASTIAFASGVHNGRCWSANTVRTALSWCDGNRDAGPPERTRELSWRRRLGHEVVERRKRRDALELHDVELRAVQEQQRSLALVEHRALDGAARRVGIGHAIHADAARADERLVRMEAADEGCGFGAEDRTFARSVVAGAQDDAAAIAAAQRIGDRKAVGDDGQVQV